MPSKGVLYYSSNELPDKVAKRCQESIAESGFPITSVTLKPTDFGRNFVSPTPKSYQTLFENILMGLENMSEDIIFFAEADILYHRTHFDFTPQREDTIYYNGNYWVVRLEDGFAVHYDMGPLSGLVAYREPLLTHYRERVAYVKENGFSYQVGFEPMTHKRIKWKNMYRMERFYPEFPNLDLYHGTNLTRRKWSPEKFVTKPKFWEESTIKDVPGWPDLPEIVEKMK